MFPLSPFSTHTSRTPHVRSNKPQILLVPSFSPRAVSFYLPIGASEPLLFSLSPLKPLRVPSTTLVCSVEPPGRFFPPLTNVRPDLPAGSVFLPVFSVPPSLVSPPCLRHPPPSWVHSFLGVLIAVALQEVSCPPGLKGGRG